MTQKISTYIEKRREMFDSWMKENLDKNNDELLRHYVPSLKLVHQETIEGLLDLVKEVAENRKQRVSALTGDAEYKEFMTIKITGRNEGLNDIINELPSNLNTE